MNELLASLDAFPPGEALFDLDGTLLQHDIAEAVLKRVLARGPLPAGARRYLGEEDPWSAYLALDPVAQSVAGATALGGFDRAGLEVLVEECFEAGDVAANEPVVSLARAVARRHRVWILTGSPEVLGEIVGARLGIRNVRGVRLRSDGPRFLDEVEGIVTCSEGKVHANWVYFGRRPVFAIGDSPWDLHLLRVAHVARTTGRIAGMEFPSYP